MLFCLFCCSSSDLAPQLIALGPRGYFSDGWLVLDFLIVIGSIADVIVTFSVVVQSVSISIIRVLRLFALLKLMRVCFLFSLLLCFSPWL